MSESAPEQLLDALQTLWRRPPLGESTVIADGVIRSVPRLTEHFIAERIAAANDLRELWFKTDDFLDTRIDEIPITEIFEFGRIVKGTACAALLQLTGETVHWMMKGIQDHIRLSQLGEDEARQKYQELDSFTFTITNANYQVVFNWLDKAPPPGGDWRQFRTRLERELRLMAEKELDDDGYFSPRELAKRFRVGKNALEQRLKRWRAEHRGDDGWTEIENSERKPREPKYLYQVRAVRPIIEDLKTTSE